MENFLNFSENFLIHFENIFKSLWWVYFFWMSSRTEILVTPLHNRTWEEIMYKILFDVRSSIGMGDSGAVNQTFICLGWHHLATLSGLRERDLCTFGNTLLKIAMSHPLFGLRVRTLTINIDDEWGKGVWRYRGWGMTHHCLVY